MVGEESNDAEPRGARVAAHRSGSPADTHHPTKGFAMNIHRPTALLVSLALSLVSTAACDSGSDAGSGASCEVSSDCPDEELCVRVGGESACAINCTLSASECSGTASCTGVGQVSASVCQVKEESSSTEEEESPDDIPMLPCSSDAQCAEFESGAVCAKWEGARDCTVTCESDGECNPPAAGGVTTEFFGCLADEGDQSRTVCLPRVECFDDPTSCITTPGPGSGGGSSSGPGPGSGGGFGAGSGGFPEF